MAITIRNKETEAMVRRLAKRWAVGPSAVIRRLAEEELARLDGLAPRLPGDEGQLWDDLMAIVPTFTEDEKREVWEEMEHMYDYLYEEEKAEDGDRHLRAGRRLSAGS